MRVLVVAADVLLLPGFTQRLREGLFDGPAEGEATMYGVASYPNNSGPLRYGQFPTVVGQESTVCAIIHLLYRCRPAAIFRTVGAIEINPIECFPFRALAHIGDEISDGFEPAIAHGYAASAVMRVCFQARVIASFYHSAVRTSQWVMRHAVGAVANTAEFSSEAAAALACSFAQIRALDGAVIAAIAKTIPDCFSLFVYVGEGEYRQAAKALVSYIFNAWTEFCGRIRLHWEPPEFSLPGPRLLVQRWGNLLDCIFIIPPGVHSDKEVCH